MSQQGPSLTCTIKAINNQFCHATINIPSPYIDAIYNEVSAAQQSKVSTYGFSQGKTPMGYIQEYYKSNIIEHIIEFLFKYFVINFLYDELHASKLYSSTEPRLYDIFVEPHHDAIFHFEISLSQAIEFQEWKHFLFKAPKRKNYKDIDRQVESFIKEEQERAKEHDHTKVCLGDWVCFDLQLLNCSKKPLMGIYQKNLWLKIGNEEADSPFQELLLDKVIGDILITDAQCLQEYFSHKVDTMYLFGLTICEVVPDQYFCFDDFKHHFRLKTNKEIHQKLIEIFSYRNDISQRRGIVEEALKLLISKHHIEAPNYMVLRQQKLVLESVQNNPDYQVYKTQRNFKDTIRLLATKQVKEMLLIDQLTHKENLSISNRDVKGYLNLIKRARTKEFIYFNPPPTKVDGQEMPIPAALFKRNCLREKTLNHIIYHLTRK
ncbi:MAG: trigger factor [Candidatus Babeliales bacterium]